MQSSQTGRYRQRFFIFMHDIVTFSLYIDTSVDLKVSRQSRQSFSSTCRLGVVLDFLVLKKFYLDIDNTMIEQ